MKRDALKRRSRIAAPSATGRSLVLSEADLQLFDVIARHGPLPSHFLYAFTRRLRRDESHLKNRLTEMYHGDRSGPYLTRPPQQFASYEARYQHLIYALAPRARALVNERGREAFAPAHRHDAFVHQAMAACIGASFDLGAMARGFRYISRSEIIAHANCPETTRVSALPLAISLPGIGERTIIPDDLFGLEFPGLGFRFFAIEVDRNTESIERKRQDGSSFGRKIIAYNSVLTETRFRGHWGIPNLTVLTVTTNTTHERNLVRFVGRNVPPQLRERFLFKTDRHFGIDWRVPKALLDHLLAEPWATADGPRNILPPCVDAQSLTLEQHGLPGRGRSND